MGFPTLRFRSQTRNLPLRYTTVRAWLRRYNPTELTVTGLRLTGCGAGVLVTQTVPLTCNIEVVGNVFADIRGPMARFLPAGSSAPDPWAQDWGCAVALAAENSTYGKALATENLTVANNVAVRIDQFYSNCQPGPGWNDGPQEQRMGLTTHGVALSNNTVQACGYNCVEMGGTTHMTVSGNVFLRDTPPDMFVYGTTDIILGDVDGTSSIIGNDFNRRGEYEGGPDGELDGNVRFALVSCKELLCCALNDGKARRMLPHPLLNGSSTHGASLHPL